MSEEISPQKILEIGMGFWASKTLLSAVELGLFTELAKGPADLATLRQKLGLHERSARDFLDALVAMKLLEREKGLYANTPETDLFLDRGKPSYVGGLLEMASARLYAHWGHLTEALRTGRRQGENKELDDVFAALYADEKRLEGFLSAMSGGSLGPARAIAEKFPWSRYESFVDVGPAQGMLPATIARAHTHLSGAGFDLPAVKPIFERYIASQGLSERVRFISGDFFTDRLPSADVIVMGRILHDWDRRKSACCLPRLLTPCRRAAR